MLSVTGDPLGQAPAAVVPLPPSLALLAGGLLLVVRIARVGRIAPLPAL
jgi:hypothetical protein